MLVPVRSLRLLDTAGLECDESVLTVSGTYAPGPCESGGLCWELKALTK